MKLRFIGIGVFLVLLLFYLSFNFLKVDYKSKCFTYPIPKEIIEKWASGQISVAYICGKHIYGETYKLPNLYFFENNTDRSDFCKRNIKNVENTCGFKVNELILDDYTDYFAGYFRCNYINMADGSIDKLIIVTKYSDSRLYFQDQFGKCNVKNIKIE